MDYHQALKQDIIVEFISHTRLKDVIDYDGSSEDAAMCQLLLEKTKDNEPHKVSGENRNVSLASLTPVCLEYLCEGE